MKDLLFWCKCYDQDLHIIYVSQSSRSSNKFLYSMHCLVPGNTHETRGPKETHVVLLSTISKCTLSFFTVHLRGFFLVLVDQGFQS